MGTNPPPLAGLWEHSSGTVCAKCFAEVIVIIPTQITLLCTAVLTLSKCWVQQSTLAIEIPASVRFVAKRDALKQSR